MKSPVREFRTLGSVRGRLGNQFPSYRDGEMALEGDIRMLDLKPYENQKELKIIIGAGKQKYEGWIDTERKFRFN